MSSRYALGIDPGRTGAVAVLEIGTPNAQVWPMPSDLVGVGRMFRDILRSFDVTVAGIEKVHGDVRFGHNNFAFGESFGALQAVVVYNKIPLHLVTPGQWQKFVGGFPARPKAVIPDGATEKQAKEIRAATSARHRKGIKAYSRAEAARLFPQLDFSLVKHDGKADAVHIARCAAAEVGNG